MFRRNFLFGADEATANIINVTPQDLYRPGAGYGFVAERNRREQELLQIPELNGAFDTMYWYADKNLTVLQQDMYGCFISSEDIVRSLCEEEGDSGNFRVKRYIPLCFKADVPRQGNYRVAVTIESPEELQELLVFTCRRRLVYKTDCVKAGSKVKIEFTVNVCDIVPRGKERIYEDKSIDISVVADRPCISRAEIAEINCPTIYIAGDSTVTDQGADYPYSPATSYAGWGQMLPAFLDSRIAVSNHSHSGLTTESFRKEGHYAVVDQYSKPRDYFLFQFGHNDQKLEQLKAGEGYRSNLVRYISECRDIGAYPLLVTPVARNSWRGNDGTYNDLLEEYAEVCLEIGRKLKVPVLDLHARSMEFVTSLGLETVKAYYFPGDFTHNNDYGAYEMACFTAREIIRVCSNWEEPGYRKLAEYVAEGFGKWQPPALVRLPVKPDLYADMENPQGNQELFAQLERPEESLTRAEALDMVMKTARFFPTNVYNDMFEDVIGHEWYAGAVECACRNGILIPRLCEGRLFHAEKEVTLEEFLIYAMNGYQSRKRLPPEAPCPYDDTVAEYARPYVRAACAIGAADREGKADMQGIITRREAADICRSLHI